MWRYKLLFYIRTYITLLYIIIYKHIFFSYLFFSTDNIFVLKIIYMIYMLRPRPPSSLSAVNV
jgi:hypothetical protein